MEAGFFSRNRDTQPDPQPSASGIAHLDDYVGHYLLDEGSVKGEISVVRRGDKLLETWPGEEPIEILPGKYDTFFSRQDAWVERFVRDKSGKVTGILYTQTDGADAVALGDGWGSGNTSSRIEHLRPRLGAGGEQTLREIDVKSAKSLELRSRTTGFPTGVLHSI